MPRPAIAGTSRRAPRACAIAALLCVALARAGAAEPAGELRIGVPRVPEALDPAGPAPPSALVVFRQLYQGLVEIDERGDIAPALASQWAVSRDGLTWTFRIRHDVQFHNGTPLDPDTVVAALLRHTTGDDEGGEPTAPWARVFRGRQAVVREVRRGPGDSVEVRLAHPFSPLLAVLAHPALAIVLPPSDGAVPVFGTGPFRVADRARGRIVLEAVPSSRAEPPRTARLVFRETDDEAARAELAGGSLDVHLFQSPPPPPAGGAAGPVVVSGPTWRMGWLALRTSEGLTARKPVRQAIAFGLDPALVGPALGRWARPWSSYLPPGTWALRVVRGPTFEPVRARKLLADARIGPATLTLLAGDVPGAPDPGRLTEAIRLSLAVAGLGVRVRQPAADAYRHALRSGEAELALFETALDLDDPHFALRPLVASELATRGGASNVAFYRNGLVDSLLLRGSQFAFRPERLRLYQRLQGHLADDLPYVPLYVRLAWAGLRPTVRDFRLDPEGRHRLDRVWLEVPPEPPAVVVPPTPAAPPAGSP
jgi:peptide/nickel transport system substrate-binding protein